MNLVSRKERRLPMVDSPSFMSLDNGDGSIPQRVMNWIVIHWNSTRA